MSVLFVRVIVWKQLPWLLLVVIIPCTLMLLTSFILEMIYMEMEIQHWCMFLENKICVQILLLKNDHMQGVLLTRIVLRLESNLSSWEISLKLNFIFSSFFFLPRYIVTLKKIKRKKSIKYIRLILISYEQLTLNFLKKI